MNPSPIRCLALALAAVLAVGCQDRHPPVKPTVQPAPASAPA
jgi:hypothetical protein